MSCMRCGKLRALENGVCDDCRDKHLEDIRRVTDYVKNNSAVNILDVVRETKVELNVVLRMLSDGNLKIHYRK